MVNARGKQTILLVEDSADFQELATLYLRSAGFQVVKANNGLEALRYLKSHEAPAAIVLDLTMPVMSGPEFLQAYDQDSDLRRIPVAIYSNEFRECRRDGGRWNVTALIAKSSSSRTFIELVEYTASQH